MGGPVAHDGTRRDAAASRRGISLATQVTAAGLTLGVVVALIFVLMARTVDAQRDAAKDAERTSRLVSAGNLLERYVIDAETGQRGFLLTRQQPFLQPLLRAKREIPPTTARVRALAGGDAATLQRIDRLRAGIDDYVRAWVEPVVALGRTDLPAARRRVQTGEGKRRVDALRRRFDAFLAVQADRTAHLTGEADDRARRALMLGIAGVVVSVLVFAAFATYVVRAIVAPVRRTAQAAGRIARGDLDARVNTAGAQAELGAMVEGFNAMADSLQRNRRELEDYAEELETQREELESAVAQLEGEHRRTALYQSFGEALASEGRADVLAELILQGGADALEAEVGALWIADARGDGTLGLAVTRGIERSAVPLALEPGAGMAGRAAVERRIVKAELDGAQLRVPAYGTDVVVRHELHVPLVQDGVVLGVLSLGRLAGPSWQKDQEELARRLSGRGAAALAKALALRESRSRLAVTRAVLDATPDAIGLIAADGRVVLANEPMRAAIGRLGAGAVVGAEPPEDEPARDELRDADGRTLARYVAALDAEGLPGRLVVLRDVTAEREADRLKDEFFALVSHELRTPLTSVIGYLELLRDDEGADPDDPAVAERAQYLSVIDRNARRLLRLVGDLLFVAQIEAGRLTLDMRRADVAAIARQAIEAARPRAASGGVMLIDDVQDVGVSHGDADRLGQAVDNLISNAVKFTPAGGTVTVSVRRQGAVAVLEVADTGMGISEDDQQRLFERFFRAGAATDAAIQGVGLGLTIVKAIVEGHGGRVDVRSRPGAGSTFRVELPLGRRAGDRADRRAPGPVVTAGREETV